MVGNSSRVASSDTVMASGGAFQAGDVLRLTYVGNLYTLTRNGSQAQQERASQLLAETKRKLYGLLADSDVHNGDDLR